MSKDSRYERQLIVPQIGENGQGKTKDEALGSLSQAIDLILVDRREDAAKGLPKDAERLMVAIG